MHTGGVLCIEEYFKKRETPEALKLLKGCVRQWSHWWNRHHKRVSWHFKLGISGHVAYIFGQRRGP